MGILPNGGVDGASVVVGGTPTTAVRGIVVGETPTTAEVMRSGVVCVT